MPHFLLFELLAPVVELTGVLLVPVSLWLGYINVGFALVFAAMALVFGIFLSVAALTLEELALRRYPSVRQLLTLVLYALLENIGYRQLTAWWRITGLVRELRRTTAVWEALDRRGSPPPSTTRPDHRNKCGDVVVAIRDQRNQIFVDGCQPTVARRAPRHSMRSSTWSPGSSHGRSGCSSRQPVPTVPEPSTSASSRRTPSLAKATSSHRS
ncbi:MAG: glycosyl transferase family 2 [Thermoleophilia bacterium]|nr:glycosyl transferase family 2 [Thermoleophilia bacterium]